jgi:iron complex outermembrane receptor protein
MYRRLVGLMLLLAAVGAVPVEAFGQDAALRGRVIGENGVPVANAVVTLRPGDHSAVSSRDGRFEFGSLSEGSYTLTVSHVGFRAQEQTVPVSAGERSQVDLRLEVAPIELERVTVIGSNEEHDQLRRRMREIPGAVQLIEPAEIERSRQSNFKDVLDYVPGVYVAPRFGAADESQLSIRGSGLRNNFHLRGVNILVNGMPYRNADGFTDFESIELLTTDNIQVYKGGNALRYGGSTLGGAINLETKTGHTAERLKVFTQAGAYGFFKGQAASGASIGDFDYYASFAHTQVDGFRGFADQGRDRLNAHVGYRLSDGLDARLFYFFADVREDLPGSLTSAEFASDPRQPNAANVAGQWGRDYKLHHAGVQLRARLGDNQTLDFAPYFQYRDIVHPIFRVLDQQSRDFGAEVRYENTSDLFGKGSRLTLGFQPATGNTDNRHFENVGGESGDLAKDQREEASVIALYAEEVLDLTPRFSIVGGARWDRSQREAEDFFLDDGDQSDSRTFEALMPKIGFIYQLGDGTGQLFGNVSRSYEPPLLLELNSFTVPGFIDLEAQDAWQFELGARGSSSNVDWSVSLYDIELKDEIININVQPFPDAPFTVPTYRNASETRHQGVEAGLGLRIPGTLFTTENGGDEITVRASYTYGSFTFTDDPDFDGNSIPGIPEHVLRAEIAYYHPVGLTLRPNVEWVPGDYFVDSQNLVTNDGWALLGIRAEYEIEELGTLLFLEARNLTDETYSPAVTVDDGSGRFFQPGDGRSVYVGLQVRP